MFVAIATRYDLLNHLLSGNVDQRWRRLVVKTLAANLPATEARVLDVACGTGDLSLALAEGMKAPSCRFGFLPADARHRRRQGIGSPLLFLLWRVMLSTSLS